MNIIYAFTARWKLKIKQMAAIWSLKFKQPILWQNCIWIIELKTIIIKQIWNGCHFFNMHPWENWKSQNNSQYWYFEIILCGFMKIIYFTHFKHQTLEQFSCIYILEKQIGCIFSTIFIHLRYRIRSVRRTKPISFKGLWNLPSIKKV